MRKDFAKKENTVLFHFERPFKYVLLSTKLRYKTTAKTVYDQPGSTLDQKDRDQSKL